MARWPALLVLVAFIALPTLAADEVSVEIRLSAERVRPGDRLGVEARFSVQPPWHVYDPERGEGITRTRIILKDAPGLSLSAWTFPAADPLKVAGLDETYFVLHGDFTARAELSVAADAAAGRRELAFQVTYQACTDRACLVPETRNIALSLQVDGGATLAPAAKAAPALTSMGWLPFLGICIAGGLLTILLPCTYPMIPITVSFFTKQGEGGRSTMRLALAYGLGIVVSFTIPGLLVALFLTGTDIQRFAANPWLNLAIGLLFVVFGASLLGYFELSLPGFVQRRVAAAGPSSLGSVAAVWTMGLIFMLTSFTCTAPAVGGLLAIAAVDPLRPVVGMAVYGATLAVPFVLLSLAPSALHRLPRSGEWMNSVKVVMGLVEVAAAFKFFSNVDLYWNAGFLSRPALLTIWIGALGTVAAFLLGAVAFGYSAPKGRPGRVRGVLIAAFLLLAAWLASGLPGGSLGPAMDGFLPPLGYPSSKREQAGDKDLESALRANTEGRRVLVEFSGHT